jgi:hypothetical protein
VLIHECGHLLQGDLCYLQNGEPATSAVELEHDAWARAAKLLDGFQLRLDRKYFLEQRDKALGVITTRGLWARRLPGMAALSPLARVVLNVLTTTGAWTADDLAAAAKLPRGVVAVNAGTASEVEPGRFAAR